MGRLMGFVLVLFCFVLSNKVGAFSAKEASQVLSRIQHFYEQTKSFQAEFEQEVLWKRGNEVDLSKGIFWLKKPGLMRWEYFWPEPLLIISRDQKVYIYSAKDHQLIELPIDKTLSPKLTWGFIYGKGDLSKDFILLQYQDIDKNRVILDLKPREKDSQIEKLRLIAEKETGEILEIWFWDCLGNITKIRFLKGQRNIKIDPKLFVFHPPKGVEIIKEN